MIGCPGQQGRAELRKAVLGLRQGLFISRAPHGPERHLADDFAMIDDGNDHRFQGQQQRRLFRPHALIGQGHAGPGRNTGRGGEG